jgi:hypothetical protein
MNEALLAAVHSQFTPCVTVTPTVPLPPSRSNDWFVELSANAHGTRACETVSVRLLTTTDPVRGAPVFAWTVTVTVPLPRPLVGVSVINAALLSAVQAHESPVMTSTVRESPPAGTIAAISVGTLSGHGSTASDGGGVTVVVDSVGVSPPAQPALNAASSSHPSDGLAINVACSQC